MATAVSVLLHHYSRITSSIRKNNHTVLFAVYKCCRVHCPSDKSSCFSKMNITITASVPSCANNQPPLDATLFHLQLYCSNRTYMKHKNIQHPGFLSRMMPPQFRGSTCILCTTATTIPTHTQKLSKMLCHVLTFWIWGKHTPPLHARRVHFL